MVLTLCRRTKALAVGDFVLGAKGSRHSQSSLVLAECSQTGERLHWQKFNTSWSV